MTERHSFWHKQSSSSQELPGAVEIITRVSDSRKQTSTLLTSFMSYRIKIPSFSFNNEASQLNTQLLVSQSQGFRNQFRDTTDCGEGMVHCTCNCWKGNSSVIASDVLSWLLAFGIFRCGGLMKQHLIYNLCSQIAPSLYFISRMLRIFGWYFCQF